MRSDFQFEQLNNAEKRLLISAFGYEVDESGFVVDSLLKEKIRSNNGGFIHLDKAALLPGSLKIMDSDPLTISKYLRENIEV